MDFAREILPVLSDKCFVCHGPTAGERQLRLDSFEGATAERRAGSSAAMNSRTVRRRHTLCARSTCSRREYRRIPANTGEYRRMPANTG